MVRCVLAFSLVGLFASSGAAQTRPDPREDARVHVGPLYLTPSVALRNFGIDTNVFNEWENPKSDFTATVVPSLALWVPVSRRFLLTTQTDAGFVYFHTFASQRTIDPHVRARADVFLRRLTLFAENDFQWARERANLEIDDRVRRRDNAARAGIEFQVTPKFSAEVSLFHQTFDYEAKGGVSRINLREALKRNERGVRVGLTHRLTSKTSLLLEGETLRARFDSSPQRSADGFRISPGVTFAPRALIGGTAKVGMRSFRPLRAEVPRYDGVVASVDLSYTLKGATRLSIETTRDIGYSYEPLQPYYVTTGVGGGLRRQVSGDIDVMLGVRRTRNAYRAISGVAPAAGIDAPRRDLILNYSIDLGDRLNRTSRLGFVVSWQQRTSSMSTLREYRGLTAGLSFSYGG